MTPDARERLTYALMLIGSGWTMRQAVTEARVSHFTLYKWGNRETLWRMQDDGHLVRCGGLVPHLEGQS